MRFTYTEINEAIAEYRQEIESVFDKCALRNSVPTIEELKTMVNYALGRVDAQATHPIAVQKKKTFKEMVDLFLDDVDEAFLKSLLADIQQKLVKTG